MKSFGEKFQLTSYFILVQKERIKTTSNRRNEARTSGGKQEHEEHKHDSQKHLTNRILEDTRR
jgi:hypothetical protein